MVMIVSFDDSSNQREWWWCDCDGDPSYDDKKKGSFMMQYESQYLQC